MPPSLIVLVSLNTPARVDYWLLLALGDALGMVSAAVRCRRAPRGGDTASHRARATTSASAWGWYLCSRTPWAKAAKWRGPVVAVAGNLSDTRPPCAWP